MERADGIDADVNRLYWETEVPVTRLAEQLGVSRGTFYNHLRPLPARATCSSCGGRLLFRNRSARDAREGHCGECGHEEQVDATAASRRAARTQDESPSVRPRGSALSSATRSAAAVGRYGEDARTGQLLLLGVGAAAVGLGLLFLARRR